jgi:Coenzyme PQQ synthesis protein D (PqqD)
VSDIPTSPASVAPESMAPVTAAIPDHVVFRVFAAETVVLNINTGQYHGLNQVAGRMLETLQGSPDLKQAAQALADEFGQPLERIEHDLRAFCDDLASRGLLEFHDPRAP